MLHNSQKDFLRRHIGPSEEDQKKIIAGRSYKEIIDRYENKINEPVESVAPVTAEEVDTSEEDTMSYFAKLAKEDA